MSSLVFFTSFWILPGLFGLIWTSSYFVPRIVLLPPFDNFVLSGLKDYSVVNIDVALLFLWGGVLWSGICCVALLTCFYAKTLGALFRTWLLLGFYVIGIPIVFWWVWGLCWDRIFVFFGLMMQIAFFVPLGVYVKVVAWSSFVFWAFIVFWFSLLALRLGCDRPLLTSWARKAFRLFGYSRFVILLSVVGLVCTFDILGLTGLVVVAFGEVFIFITFFSYLTARVLNRFVNDASQ